MPSTGLSEIKIENNLWTPMERLHDPEMRTVYAYACYFDTGYTEKILYSKVPTELMHELRINELTNVDMTIESDDGATGFFAYGR